MKLDHLLLIGFGGPRKPDEIGPFIRQVTQGLTIPEPRLKEVEHHYQAIGGSSPYNEHALAFAREVAEGLKGNGSPLPTFLGMRCWHPFLKEVLSEIKLEGFKNGLGIVLAPHRSEASFDRYVRAVQTAQKEAAAEELHYDYLEPWHGHPLFIEAEAEQICKIYNRLPLSERESTHLLFSAHSIPLEMARRCRYAEEVRESSSLVAERLGHPEWSLAFQSRSGHPREAWLEPDVRSVIREFGGRGVKRLLVIPIGFLSENAEVLYDLDHEARVEAERMGMRYLRAETVMKHPKFAAMMTELIQEKLNAQ